MPTHSLTARFVASVKPTRARVEYFDREVPGLVLRVTPSGAKSWSIRYWHRGRQRRLTIGSAAVLSLSVARDRARDELYEVSQGNDPAGRKREAATAATVADLVDLYIEKWAKPRKRSWRDDDRRLRKHVLPVWRHRAPTEITRADVRRLVEAIADDGAAVEANRVTSLLSKLFAFALDRDLVPANPAARIRKPTVERPRDRVLTEDELQTLWAAWEGLGGPMAAYYKLRLLTAQRGGEVAAMRWQDVDRTGHWWTIPAAVSKNGLPHRVPICAEALGIISSLHAAKETLATEDVNERTIEKRTYVVAGARGKRQQADAARAFAVADFRGHDLRRTAASLMAGGGIPRLTISKILNHVERDVTAVYDRHSYDAEKVAALAWWDAKVKAILNGKGSKVLPFNRAARV